MQSDQLVLQKPAAFVLWDVSSGSQRNEDTIIAAGGLPWLGPADGLYRSRGAESSKLFVKPFQPPSAQQGCCYCRRCSHTIEHLTEAASAAYATASSKCFVKPANWPSAKHRCHRRSQGSACTCCTVEVRSASCAEASSKCSHSAL